MVVVDIKTSSQSFKVLHSYGWRNDFANLYWQHTVGKVFINQTSIGVSQRQFRCFAISVSKAYRIEFIACRNLIIRVAAKNIAFATYLDIEMVEDRGEAHITVEQSAVEFTFVGRCGTDRHRCLFPLFIAIYILVAIEIVTMLHNDAHQTLLGRGRSHYAHCFAEVHLRVVNVSAIAKGQNASFHAIGKVDGNLVSMNVNASVDNDSSIGCNFVL